MAAYSGRVTHSTEVCHWLTADTEIGFTSSLQSIYTAAPGQSPRQEVTLSFSTVVELFLILDSIGTSEVYFLWKVDFQGCGFIFGAMISKQRHCPNGTLLWVSSTD